MRKIISKVFPQRLKNIWHLITGLLACILYGFPASKLRVIGVTGTDGKTTTASLIHAILSESGKKTGLVSTVNARIGNKKYDTGFHVTNPNSFALQKFLRKMVDIGCEYAVLEVTSHGIDQNRIVGINFEVAVLTNITPEHLDYHKNFEAYRNTKARLFEKVKIAILNKDDASVDFIAGRVTEGKVVTYGFSKDSEYWVAGYKSDNDTKIRLAASGGEHILKTRLSGDYNVSNTLAAVAASRELGVSWEGVTKALAKFESPKGRFEEIKNNRGIKIIVDYAHTPNAVEKVLSVFAGQTRGRLISIVSAEGERDPGKRKFIPLAAVKLSDITVLNPIDTRSEDPARILAQMEAGAKLGKAKKVGVDWFDKDSRVNGHVFLGFLDRGEAINFVISKVARRGDTVVICGKGHETGMDYGNVEKPWSDQRAVQEALSAKQGV